MRPALILPLRTTETVAGVVVIARDKGRDGFTEEQLNMMAAFTDQATWLALSNGVSRRMRELDVLSDRERNCPRPA